MLEKETEEQKYVANLPGKKNNFTSKHTKGNIGEKKLKGKSDTKNNNSKGTNGMHDNISLTKHQMEPGKGKSKPHQAIRRDTVKDKLRY